ncbi:YkgJ family cysteine cluster protein [Geotalea sp. SG265]|uniref:YkgJ family cysteine cluster protein n=1 Tax=Geotalea sp. SG265 TaxID=2922867 RepID=UPI001FAF7736|nr:YkgJ family cysteine cluster protein [Geotalea sp. SG265]
MEGLNNYRTLLAKIDEMTTGISAAHAADIACRKGCDRCCRHLSLFPVEGVALAVAFRSLSADRALFIRAKARSATADGPCPLLENGECALYAHRPIICRTHGLPVLVTEEGGQRLDFCPLNFTNAESLSGDAVVDLEKLNTLLAAVNKLFVTECWERKIVGKERLSLAEALLL